MHGIVGRAWPWRTWSSYMHKIVIRVHVTEQKSHKICTYVHRNWESGLAIIYQHAAHRLVQHRLQVIEMAWTDDSTLTIFFYMRYPYPPSCCSLESSDQHRHRGSGKQDKPHWQIAIQLRYCSSHWIGPVSVLVIAIKELDYPWFNVFNYGVIFWI